MTSQSLIVQKGDCPWKIAKKSLELQNKPINNKAILKEINRLSQINGCETVEEFGTKFFSSTGTSIFISSQDQSKQVKNNTQTQKNQQTKQIQQSDSTQTKKQTQKPDSTQTKKQIQQTDSTKTVKQTQQTDSTKIIHKQQLKPKNETLEQEVTRINSMKNDLTKIIQYNKNHYQGEYYGVVDKKTCQLTIYNKSGQIVKKIPVGIGKTKGDGLSNYYLDHYNHTKNEYLAEQNRYTTPGEFTLDEHIVTPQTHTAGYTGTDGKYRVMGLKGDNRGVRCGQQSIHVVYNNDPKRIKGIKSIGVEDNRISYGCVNLLQEDYDKMHKLLGEGDKIFILPEEKGNKLQLEKQPDGSYLFHQQNHKTDQRDHSVADSSKVNYDVRPDRNPKLIAQETSTASKQVKSKPQQKTQKYAWYDPRGWIS